MARATDSVKAIWFEKSWRVDEESIVMKPDGYTNEVQYVVGRISAVQFDPRTAARIETHGDPFHGPVGCVPWTSEAVGIEYSCHSNEMGGGRRCPSNLRQVCDG